MPRPRSIKAAQPAAGKNPLTTRVWRSLSGSRGGRFAGDTLRGVDAVIHGFRGERISLRAAALTFISVLSLIPLLTVAVVLIQSLHQQQFQQRLLSLIHHVLGPGVRAESQFFFDHFVDRASSVTAGGVGFLLLLISAGSLLRNLDASLNEIWGIRKHRPLWIRLCSYAAILLLGPLLLALSLVITTGLHRLLLRLSFPWAEELLVLGSLTVVVGALTLVYLIAPNAPVRFRSALSGGLVAGIGWALARSIFSAFGAQIFRANPVYGSLGGAPLFLMWIYTSWLLILFGARLAYAVEYASFQGTFRALGNHPRARELVAAQMAQLITLAQLSGKPAPTPRELALALEVPEETVRDIAEQLEGAGLLARVRHGGLVPARPPDQLTVADLSTAVGGVIGLLASPPDRENRKEFEHLENLFAQIDQATVDRLGKITWRSLIASRDGRVQPVPLRQAQAKARRSRRNP